MSKEDNVDHELAEEIREYLEEYRTANKMMKAHQTKVAHWADKRTLAQVELHFAEKDANEATLRIAHTKPKKREREEEKKKVEEPPLKKKDDSEWKCAGNVLLGQDNPGCPGGTENHRTKAPQTTAPGKDGKKHRFDTCKACKVEMRKTKKKSVKE